MRLHKALFGLAAADSGCRLWNMTTFRIKASGTPSLILESWSCKSGGTCRSLLEATWQVPQGCKKNPLTESRHILERGDGVGCNQRTWPCELSLGPRVNKAEELRCLPGYEQGKTGSSCPPFYSRSTVSGKEPVAVGRHGGLGFAACSSSLSFATLHKRTKLHACVS